MSAWNLKRRLSARARGNVVRADYRFERLAFLQSLVDVSSARGLEIGAFDLPTVLPEDGPCEFADWRSTDELVRVFKVPPETLAPVTWVVEREHSLSEQIAARFDYVILCHVLEHVPDAIGFLADVARLVRRGGVVVAAVPDKRETYDSTRHSTTLDQLLDRHHVRAREPSLAQIMEFSRAWSEDLRDVALRSSRDFYEFAVAQLESGCADAHCNVWQDEEMFAQLDVLIRDRFLPGVELVARGRNTPPFNEFYVGLRKTEDATS